MQFTDIWHRSRPRFHLYLLGPVLLGLAAGVKSPSDLLSWELLATAIYFWLPANILLYVVNDWFDRKADLSNAKKKNYEKAVDEDTDTRLIFLTIIGVGTLSLLYSLGLPQDAKMYLLAFLTLSIGYSMPPLRFKARPVLDSASNILYAVPAFLTYNLLTGMHPSWEWWLLALSWTMGMHTFSAIPDIVSDRQAAIDTTATTLGDTGAANYVAACWIVSAGVGILIGGIWAIPLLIYPLLGGVVATANEPISRSWELYRYFPMINGFIGFYGFWAIAYQSGFVSFLVEYIMHFI